MKENDLREFNNRSRQRFYANRPVLSTILLTTTITCFTVLGARIFYGCSNHEKPYEIAQATQERQIER